MKNFSIILSTVAIILAVVAIVSVFKTTNNGVTATPASVISTSSGPVSQADLAAVLNRNPKLVFDAMQAYERQQREEQERAAAALLEQYAGEISSDTNVPFVGPKDAKVVVTEFYDFSCGFCKRLAPELEKVIADNADVKFVFKPLTFLGPISLYKAKAAYAADKQGKFIEFYTAAMNGNANNEAEVDEMAGSFGINMANYKKDLASSEVSNKISEVASFAQKIQVNGVPALFINGKPLNGRSAAEIQSAIDAAK